MEISRNPYPLRIAFVVDPEGIFNQVTWGYKVVYLCHVTETCRLGDTHEMNIQGPSVNNFLSVSDIQKRLICGDSSMLQMRNWFPRTRDKV